MNRKGEITGGKKIALTFFIPCGIIFIMKNSPKEFRDKHDVEIKSGNLLIRHFYARQRERPGNKRVAINSMTGQDVIVLDEGALKSQETHWIIYEVGWSGACMIAERRDCSDLDIILSSELYDEAGHRIHEGTAFYYMNSVFDSKVYEVLEK